MEQDGSERTTFLSWLGVSDPPNWNAARSFGPVLSILYAFALLLGICATLSILFRAAFDNEDTTLGAGALAAAVLGSPFIIWSTVLKHRTVMFQKEGHITDRINKATEQLGAEKTIKQHLVNSHGKKVYLKNTSGKIDHSQPVIVEESAPNLEVRIGAILSLERIAQDSVRYDNGRDHVRVMEILSAYVRENSRLIEPKRCPEKDWTTLSADASEEESAEHNRRLVERFQNLTTKRNNFQAWVEALPKLRTDIQLAITVIGRRSKAQKALEANWRAPSRGLTTTSLLTEPPALAKELTPTDLRSTSTNEVRKSFEAWRKSALEFDGYRIDFRGANLQKADLSASTDSAFDADFSGMLIEGASLDGANFSHSKVKGVAFSEVSLTAANFDYCNLSATRFTNFCNLESARFINANLVGAMFSECLANGCTFTGANLDFSQFDGCELEGSLFRHVQSRFLVMSDSKCFGSDSHLADFSSSIFSRVHNPRGLLAQAKSTSAAAFRRIDLTSLNTRRMHLEESFGDLTVKIPNDTERPVHWSDTKLDIYNFYVKFCEWHGAWEVPNYLKVLFDD